MLPGNETFQKVAGLLESLHLKIVQQDKNRPWGGFFVIDEKQSEEFAKHFFPEEAFEKIKITEKLSPKILMVAPHKRLSWQYHHRRAELWKCMDGEVAVATSDTDSEEEKCILKPGDKIILPRGKRHRLIQPIHLMKMIL
jgi:mannose-6-phosphate isomerase